MEHQELPSPHVVFVPLPLQGHVTPMLQLAEIFCLDDFKVTFISSTHIHQRLVEAGFGRYPKFGFKIISDGLPDDHQRSGYDGATEVCCGFKSNLEPIFKEMITGFENKSPVTCLIVDGWLNFVHDAGNEANIPVIIFRTFSACCLWIYFCIPDLIKAGEIPFKDEDMDRLVQQAPGMEHFLRCRDLPVVLRGKDTSSCHELQQSFASEMQRTQETYGLILNTFEELEGPMISRIRSQCGKVFSIGPLHAHLRYRLNLADQTTRHNSSSKDLWKVDRSCITWLDQKPDRSTVYVSFGSLTILTKEQLLEIWAGLVQSKRFFLWVIRPNLITGSNPNCSTPDELMDVTMDRGCIVGWAPQEEILAHRAVGGFLTHSGWNSTLESIFARVPMLCWPSFGDQQVNSRYISEVFKIGLDMKDKCDRNMVVKMINELMDNKELEEAMATKSDLAKKAVTEGGSSYRDLGLLTQDIKLTSMKTYTLNSF